MTINESGSLRDIKSSFQKIIFTVMTIDKMKHLKQT